MAEDITRSLLATLHAKELGARRIIAKGVTPEHGKILKSLGAERVVFPEAEIAVSLADRVTWPNIVDFVPIDPEYPADRVAFMVKGAGAPVVLTQAKWDDLLAGFEGERFRLDADWARLKSTKTANPGYEVTGDQLAYMIYTSGSTGRPKGAMNTHRGIANRLLHCLSRSLRCSSY